VAGGYAGHWRVVIIVVFTAATQPNAGPAAAAESLPALTATNPTAAALAAAACVTASKFRG
jgi:hypothetical protein